MTPDGHPQPGEILAGKYVIEDVLGVGGMGVVVAARHLALRQRVAVKFLLPHAARIPDATPRLPACCRESGLVTESRGWFRDYGSRVSEASTDFHSI